MNAAASNLAWGGRSAARRTDARVGLGVSGWDAVEALWVGGVPYQVLLTQRAVGGAWLAHRNRTSTKLAPLLADRLCQELQARHISFQRSTSLGGSMKSRPRVVSAAATTSWVLLLFTPIDRSQLSA